MEKTKFIADKIQKLIKDGESKNKATAIAFAEYNSMQEGGELQYMQKGSTVAYNENKQNSHLKKIDYIQQGVYNDKLGDGYYFNNSDGTREFVTEQAYQNNKNENAIRDYNTLSGGIGMAVPGTEAKNYKPANYINEENSKLLPIDYIKSGVTNDKLGSGYYFHYKNGLREFVKEDAYQENKNSNSIREYNRLSGGVGRRVPGTEGKDYRPRMQTGGYYDNNNPYFMNNPGEILPNNQFPQQATQIDYNKNYMGMTNEQENLSTLTEDKNVMSKEEYDRIRLANLYGDVNPMTYGFGLGKAIEQKDGFGAVVNGVGLGLGTVKNVLSGMGDSRMGQYAYDKYREDQMDDTSQYKSLQQGGFVPQLKKKENAEINEQNINKTNAELLTGEYLTEGSGENEGDTDKYMSLLKDKKILKYNFNKSTNNYEVYYE